MSVPADARRSRSGYVGLIAAHRAFGSPFTRDLPRHEPWGESLRHLPRGQRPEALHPTLDARSATSRLAVAGIRTDDEPLPPPRRYANRGPQRGVARVERHIRAAVQRNARSNRAPLSGAIGGSCAAGRRALREP